MKKVKTITAIGVGFALILGWAMLLPQYFPYDTLIKLYYTLT